MPDTKERPQPMRLSDIESPLNDEWGRWRYDDGNLVLRHEDGYEVPVAECVDSAKTLDWIAQVAGKTWATVEDLGNLVRALDELIDLQAVICGNGTDGVTIGLRGRLRRRREIHEEQRRDSKRVASDPDRPPEN